MTLRSPTLKQPLAAMRTRSLFLSRPDPNHINPITYRHLKAPLSLVQAAHLCPQPRHLEVSSAIVQKHSHLWVPRTRTMLRLLQSHPKRSACHENHESTALLLRLSCTKMLRNAPSVSCTTLHISTRPAAAISPSAPNASYRSNVLTRILRSITMTRETLKLTKKDYWSRSPLHVLSA